MKVIKLSSLVHYVKKILTRLSSIKWLLSNWLQWLFDQNDLTENKNLLNIEYLFFFFFKLYHTSLAASNVLAEYIMKCKLAEHAELPLTEAVFSSTSFLLAGTVKKMSNHCIAITSVFN